MNAQTRKSTHFLLLSAAQLGIVTGCGLVKNPTSGAPRLSAAESTVPSRTSAPTAEGTESSGVPSAEGSNASVVKSDAVTAAEKKLTSLFPKETHYSAASVQGKGSPLCPTPAGAKALSVWLIDVPGNLDCFAMSEHASHANFEAWKSLRDPQDNGMLSKPKAVALSKGGALFANITNGTFWAFEYVNGVARLFESECAKGASVESGVALRQVEQICDLTKTKFDVVMKDAAAAKAVNLEGEESRFKARAVEFAKARGAASERRDLEAMEKVKFPAAVGNDAKVTEAVRRYIAENRKKTDIDATKIKRLAQTEDWRVVKSPIGMIMHRKAGVTVGFERSDAYAGDPNKKCVFATFEVQEDHDGATFAKPFATGMASSWTTIPCARLK